MQWRSAGISNVSIADGFNGDTARDGTGEDEAGFIRILQNPAPVASAGITAGLLWWLTRSGGLLTSILMGVPAWRHVDLLPVLARPADAAPKPVTDDPDDDDSAADDFDDSAVASLFDEPALEHTAEGLR